MHRSVLLVAAADAAEAGRPGRDSAPARRWVERTLSTAAPRGAVVEQGDGIAFPTVGAALEFSLDLTERASGTGWRVAMAVHAGAALRHRAACLLAAAHGGQVLVTAEAAHQAPSDVELVSLGPHLLADLAPPQEVYELRHGEGSFPPLRSLDVLPHNLPVQPTALVGQADMISEVASALERQAVVTLTGPGGVGKTRNAVQTAASVAHLYPDGVFLVALADVGDAARVPDHVADTVGFDPARPIEESLRGRHMLVVLDNCEHLLEACANLAVGLTRACPGVRVLATSRRRLGVRGEAVVAIRPLGAASPDDEAVMLFVDHARLAASDFAITDANEASVLEICRCLDGLPLAIELAAAHVRWLNLDEIAGRLEDRLAFLASGPRDADARHRTLEDLVGWSYDLLDERERIVFTRLSVFAGGCEHEAAQVVCSDDDLGPDDISRALERLVDGSLVTASRAGGTTRYGMLETLRAFAAARLGSGDDVRARHLAWAVDLVGRGFGELWGPGREEWLRRLETERANVEAALRWALDTGLRAEALELAASYGPVWQSSGRLREGRAWLEEALGGREAGDPASVGRAFGGAGAVSFLLGDLDAARSHFLDAAATCPDPLDAEVARINLATVERAVGRPREARRLLEGAVAHGRESGDGRVLSSALSGLGTLALAEGDDEGARSAYEESLALARERGDLYREAYALGNLAVATGGHEARPLLEVACALHRKAGDMPAVASVLCNLAELARDAGDEAGWRELANEALQIAREFGLASIEARCAELLGSTQPTVPAAGRWTFRRDGASWMLSDGERIFRLRNAKGLGHLAKLLAKPGVEIHCLQLTVGYTADTRTFEDLRERLQEAERWGDADRASDVRREMDELAAETDIAGAAAERARQAVAKAIRASVDRITRFSPSLGRHLSTHVRTGLYCCYLPNPDDQVSWDLGAAEAEPQTAMA